MIAKLKQVSRKVWASLVALFTRSANLHSDPVEAAPAPVAQPIDYPESHPSDLRSDTSHGPSLDHDIPHGSPLKAIIDQLDRVFPAPVIKPGAVLDDLQYKAGPRAVVDWLRLQQQRGKT